MIDFQWHKFSELTAQQLYEVLKLRCEVFIIEQNCAFQDPDGNDPKALHLLGYERGVLVAYLRLFPPVDGESSLVFGRIVTEKSARTKGYGKKLMEELLAYCDTNFPGAHLECSAQTYLQHFYESFGFAAYGAVYEEDGIPHIAMKKMAR